MVSSCFRGFRFMASLGILMAAHAALAGPLDKYNIVWDSPSQDATGSMPLSGGNIGLNVWVEPSSPEGSTGEGGDDLLFYIGHPDSRLEDEKLVKLGRVRLSLSTQPFRKKFRQELFLEESRIRITGDDTVLDLWVDAFQPVVHVELKSGKPTTVNVAYESWRFTAQPIANGLEWAYRLDPNRDSRAAKLKAQNAQAIADTVPDPLKNLTLGGRIVAEGLVSDGTGEGVYMRTPYKAWKVKTKAPVTKLDLRVLVRVAQDDSVEAWRTELDKLQAAKSDRKKTIAWWKEFWKRSYIRINPAATSEDNGWQVGRNYQLFRYMLAGNRTGKFPTLFNGGIHTFDNPAPNPNAWGSLGPSPDERAWWGCHFMAQNQRLVYWPMLKAGDIDLLAVGLDFYRDRAPVAQAKARHHLGVEGTLYDESLDIFGLTAAGASANGLNGLVHLTYHFTTGIEFAYMMLEECRFTGRDVKDSLPVMMGMLKFYDNFYQQENQKRTGKPLGDDGKLVIFPGNSVEMGTGCKNHVDAVSGLQALTEGLLQLPGTDREWLEALRKRIPDIPTEEKNGKRFIKMAESWQGFFNANEFPQMYAVFPFHRYGVGLPDIELARNTWRSGGPIQKEPLCWKYGNIATADLGLAAEAQRYAMRKFLYPFEGDGNTYSMGNCAPFRARFPAFWVTYPHCASPDMDHGGCAMVGLQEMLLQTPGDRLLLLPAWQADWDVHFKLYAPKNTTVECELRGGKIVKLKVEPASRRKDVEIIGPAPVPIKPLSQGRPVKVSSTYVGPGYDAAKAVDGDPATRWASDEGARAGWLEVDLGEELVVGSVLVSEIDWPETLEFAIEVRQGDAWREVARGATIGEEKVMTFPPVKARYVRLNVLKAKGPVNINEFQVYPASKH